MAWIDYKKAYDSVPHSWTLECLDIYKVNRNVIDFISTIMPSWKTSLVLNHNQGTINVPNVKIKRGIYLGDKFVSINIHFQKGPFNQTTK